jgi:hypothetical protein
MSFDSTGRPTAGTAIVLDVGNDSSQDLVITGISVATATLDDGPGASSGCSTATM